MACFGAGLRLVGKEAKMSPNSAIPRLLSGVLGCMACTSLLVAADQEGVHVCIGRHPLAEWHGRARLHHGQAAQMSRVTR